MGADTSLLDGWRQVRRFAVPRWMIEQATALRSAGDWRGACAAADIEVDIDLAGIGRDHGTAVAEAVEDDLRHLAPDLLRWHLDRDLWPRVSLRREPTLLSVHPGGQLLVVPRYRDTSRPRLVLRFAGPADPRRGLHTNREQWDVRCTGDLLARQQPCPDAAEILALQDAGQWREALRLAGFDIDALADLSPMLEKRLSPTRLDLTTLAAAAREFGRPEATIDLEGECLWIDGFRHRIHLGYDDRRDLPPVLPMARMERSIDADLVRLGLLSLDELHPLVAAAMVPGHKGAAGPAPRVDMSPFTVPCGSERHRIGPDGIPHPPEEIRREQSLHALGGPTPTGCFAAHIGWRDPSVPVPKVLRRRRSVLVDQARNGDGPALTAWLDAGLDPHLRTGESWTLLHLIAWLPDPAALVTRLVAAGLDLEAQARGGNTPLRHAIGQGGSVAAIRALAAAGAVTTGWADAAERANRLAELQFLATPC
ncbi:hypothetical protein ACFO1B_16415 [Dactylosporangium siamense]|uniref:Ankyrin repeat domain-containing protein n=1 Tax=Dactylosporangium siamense TaxID=685454 RepID=A0A919PLI4_9ACTN|nr:hypothetical protein [Dactylosporangium siamense]GIG45426.1 hypothetical protein Dsi01nite_034670 [Dactylosporangium siamense]